MNGACICHRAREAHRASRSRLSLAGITAKRLAWIEERLFSRKHREREATWPSLCFQNNHQYCILTLGDAGHRDVSSKQLEYWLSPPSRKLSSKDPVAAFPFQRQRCYKYNLFLLTSQSSPCGHQVSPRIQQTIPLLLFFPQPRLPPPQGRQRLERNSIHQDTGKSLARPCPVRICPHSSTFKASNHTYLRASRWQRIQD